MSDATHTRVVLKKDGTYNVESSSDRGVTWNQEIHRKFWYAKLAKAHAKVNFPAATYLGEVSAE